MASKTLNPPEAEIDPWFGPEYASVRLRGQFWGLLSWAFFLAAAGSRFLMAVIPPMSGWGYPWKAFASALCVPFLSGIGIGFALLGKRRGSARWAFILNVLAIAISIVLIWVFFEILPPGSMGYFRRSLGI